MKTSTNRPFSLGSQVSLVDCEFPDGGDVTGSWTVLGYKGVEIDLERYGTVIRCPARCCASAVEETAAQAA